MTRIVPGIALHGLGKTYRTGSGDIVALSGIDLTIAPGECVALLGPSGCGKTTLLRIIAGLETASAGQIDQAGAARKGVVFQDANLFPWFRVGDNIALPLRLDGVGKAARRARAAELAKLVGIAGFERRYPDQLSGGMRQRAAIARALIRDPEILLMDEPFGALDALTRDEMNRETQRIWSERGCTLVLVTHSIAEAVFLADRVVLMTKRPGRIARITLVNLPRPRPLSVQSSAEFQAIVASLREALEAGQ